MKKNLLFVTLLSMVFLAIPTNLFAQEEKKASDYMEAAQQGDAQAQVKLGEFYYLGKGGVEENSAEAFKWFSKSAEQNNGEAFYYLGNCYLFGSGVAKNIDEALKMYNKAVELKYGHAAYMVGDMYKEGRGLPKDLDEAIRWFKKGADLGDGFSKYELKKYSSEPEEIQKNSTVTKQIIGIVLNGNYYPVSQENVNRGTIELINMGTDGNTIILDLDIPELKQQKITSTYSWSGAKVKLFRRVDNGETEYLVLRGQTPCGGLFQNKDGWIAMMSGKGSQTISDLRKGMSRLKVEQLCSELGLSKFKPAGTSNGLKVYTLQWLNMQKRRNFIGSDYHYGVNNNKVYGKFYFNSQDKLVKWILF